MKIFKSEKPQWIFQDEMFKLTCFDAALVLEEQWVRISGVSNDDRFWIVDIVLDYVGKGVAITALADKLGISADQVMALEII